MTKFDNLFSSFLSKINEDMPVDLYPGVAPGAGERVAATFPERANYALTPEQVTRVVNDVIDYLQTRNNHSPLPYKDFQAAVVASKIVINSSLNKTKAKYAARVVHNAMIDANIITDERSGTKINTVPEAEEVENLADDIVDEVNTQIAAAPEVDREESSSFYKAKDFPTGAVEEEEEENTLEQAWNSIPDDKDVSWTELLKLVGLSVANSLKEIGAIIPSESKAENDNEEKEISDIEFDEFDEPDLSDEGASREIDPNYSERRSPYRGED